ncbi:unnamed protein product [Pleuronectes platessa]|uniref:BTB domain-containing protein n=1 Tax=Pleuronectes platessa TaxID=8262 RepID=A0A9N7Y8I3_PLEPL|nr:unnamed protein product [Pleuronectes platessa]
MGSGVGGWLPKKAIYFLSVGTSSGVDKRRQLNSKQPRLNSSVYEEAVWRIRTRVQRGMAVTTSPLIAPQARILLATPPTQGSRDHFGGLGYGIWVAWHQLRPFIPFFLISFMVVALVYLMQAIIYGGPFKDPLFFVKFNERWPRPALHQQDSPAPTEVFSPVPSSSPQQVLLELYGDNETMRDEEQQSNFAAEDHADPWMTSEEWTEEPRKNKPSLGPVHREVKGHVLRTCRRGLCARGGWIQQFGRSRVDGEMWCYQKPGFEALLLAELQRQQQRSQFCDTLLKAEGVSVPAHSCLLSAISPLVSSTLSSTPAPPAGESRLVEFQSLDSCTLLRMVRLLYSGEMAGEGEKEKQEAISAAANLGIHGLVEVTRRDHKSSVEEGGGRHVEVGVQTEPMMLEDYKKKRVKWRREVRDGCTLLWKETQSYSEKDMWTQTEELQGSRAPSTPSATSVETMDMAALHNAEQTDAQILPFQIPHIPISLLYLPENQINQPPSASAASMQDSTAAEPTAGAVAVPPFCSVPLSLQPFSTLCARDATEGEEWLDEQFERFQGNIPGFINNFLHPDKEEGGGRGRAGRSRGAGGGRPRRAGAAERRAGRPRGSTGGRWRGRLTQTVDVQKVGVSKVQKLFLQRWGRRSTRTGQGGGAAGRKLYLKTREFLRSANSYRRSRSRGKVLEFSQSEEMLPHSQAGGGGSTKHGQRTPVQKVNQDGLPGSGTRSSRAKSTTSYSITPVHFYNIDTLSSPHLQPSPSPAASYMPPASSLHHTTCLPVPEPPPCQIDCLLEEVMSGLDIFPKSSSFPGSRHPRPTRGSSCTYVSSGNSLAQSKQVSTTELLEAFHGSEQVAGVTSETSTSSSAHGEVPVMQLQGEGELNHMLELFLHSFEQHVENCHAREEEETNGEISTEPSKSTPVLNSHRKTKTKTTRPVIRPHTESQQGEEADSHTSPSQPHKASAQSPAPLRRAEGTSGNHRTQRKREYKKKKTQHLFSLEKRRVRRKPVPLSYAEIKILHGLRDKRLQQIPVVKLERRGPIPVRVTLQAYSCQRLEVKDSGPLLYQPLVDKSTSAGSSRGRSKENGHHVSLPHDGSSTPVDRFATSEQLEENQERHEVELTVEPQEEEEEPTRRGVKRRAESWGETHDVAKRICFEPVTDPTSETCIHSSGSAELHSEQADTEAEEVIDVESVSLTSVGGCLEGGKKIEIEEVEETEEGSMYEEAESSADEIIDVDGDTDGGTNMENDTGGCRAEAGIGRTLPSLSHCVSTPSAQEGSTGLTGSREEEVINVIGDSSPSLSR